MLIHTNYSKIRGPFRSTIGKQNSLLDAWSQRMEVPQTKGRGCLNCGRTEDWIRRNSKGNILWGKNSWKL